MDMRSASTQRLGAAPRKTFPRRTACLGLLAVMAALALAAGAHAYVPGAPVWLRTFGGAANHEASCWDVTAGPDGNIVQTGWADVTPAQHNDILVLKYDAAGHRKFTQTFNGRRNGNDYGMSVAVDRWGNVYVAGVLWVSSTNTDLVLLKYGPTGKRLWVQTYDGPAHMTDEGDFVAVDSLGNAYVAGASMPDANHRGIVLIKFDAKGHRKWVTRIDPPKSSPAKDADGVKDIALDAAGNLYLCGWSVFTVSSTDYYGALTYKFDASGHKKWAQVFYAKPASARATGEAIAVRGARVVVAGEVWRASDRSDYLVLSYDLAGHAKYAFTYHSKINKTDYASDVALDANLNAYVTGNASTGTVASWGEGFMTLKLDSRGRLQWGRLLGEGEGYYLVTDAAGNVYVTGYFSGGGPGEEWATAKYSPKGYRRWLQTWGGKNSFNPEPSGIVLGGANGVFAGGEGAVVSGPDTFLESALIRYNR
jgi:hypothetical protein